MRILYDFQVLTNIVSGASRSFCEIASRINKIEQHSAQFEFLFSENIFMKEIFHKERKFLPKLSFKGKTRLQILIEIFYAQKELCKQNYDIIHSTGESIYFEHLLHTPFVSTIHDMIPERFIKNSPRIKNREKLLKLCDRIVCVSKNTKNELLECYPWCDPNKIDVVYHGINQNINEYEENTFGDYILYTGVRDGYKNFLPTIKALLPLLYKYPFLKIVCTGSSFKDEEIKFFVNNKIERQMVNVGFVSNKILFSLYHFARLFIFPSLYEGFGIPILEAFTTNCPACICKASCFPEIGGDAVSYFNGNDAESILYSVTNVLENDSFANDLRKRGQERVKNFTWEKSTEDMLSCYEKALM